MAEEEKDSHEDEDDEEEEEEAKSAPGRTEAVASARAREARARADGHDGDGVAKARAKAHEAAHASHDRGHVDHHALTPLEHAGVAATSLGITAGIFFRDSIKAAFTSLWETGKAVVTGKDSAGLRGWKPKPAKSGGGHAAAHGGAGTKERHEEHHDEGHGKGRGGGGGEEHGPKK